MAPPTAYPASLAIDYPNRELNRLTTFFRLFAVIPIAIILGLVSGSTVPVEGDKYLFGTGGVVFRRPRSCSCSARSTRAGGSIGTWV